MDFTNVSKKDPCPCGSGRKFKHCHGTEERQVGFTPVARTNTPGLSPELAEQQAGMDPNQMDPQLMMQFAQALQKLPKGQMQKLQSLMQKAMGGKDVSREAAELEKTFPPEFMNLIQGMQNSAPASDSEGAIAGSTTNTSATQEERAAAQGKFKSIWNKVMRR